MRANKRLLAGLTALTVMTAAGAAAALSPVPVRPGPAHAAGAARPPLRAELLVSARWLAAHRADPGVVVLHVAADPAEYAAGHVPGARFLALSSIVTERDGVPNELPPAPALAAALEAAGVGDGARVILYGAPLAAARAFFTLDYLGHGARAAILDGGLPAWREAGQRVSTAAPAPAHGVRFTPRGAAPARRGAGRTGLGPGPGGMVDLAWVRAHLGDPHVALLDARPEAQYTGAEAGHGVVGAGHIPGAGNLYWERTLTGAQAPRLRDTEALRALFVAAGAAPGKMVVTYCRTGMQASWLYFVARYLGYEARLYDGSFIEWSGEVSTPVEGRG